ncbi:MAG: NADAR family protein, partial [Gracilibacteraceae bacterium]|nr:NADAR family protein [Gracilibacteraceae bacterium]
MDFTTKNPMPPPWIMYPHISRYSIGWRMGYGESYKYDFWDWFESLTDSEQELYKEMFPAPKLWRGVYNKGFDYDDPADAELYEYETIQLWNKNGACQYSRQELADKYDARQRNFVFFWKPQDEAINESCLGQWRPSLFKVDIDEYSCAEQYMMAEKARLFADEEVCDSIMKAKDPKTMKALGKKVKFFDQTIWDKVKYSIVLSGNYYKFSQNKEMREYLLSTGNRVLVEASPMDT